MLRRIYFDKDTWITNKRLARGYATGSNHGMDESLEIFKKEEEAGNYGYTFAKILGKVDHNQIVSMSISGGATVKYELHMYDLTHGDTLPYSYDLETFPMVSRSWDEGRGVDSDCKDDGYANWFSGTSTEAWTTSGAFDEYSGNLSGSMHFDTGWEDYVADISDLVSYWVSGSDNYGFIVKLLNAQEDDANEYYKKSFYSSQCKDLAKRPFVEIRYDDAKFDDRKNVFLDNDTTLYMYRHVNGQLKNFPSNVDNVYVKVVDTVSGSDKNTLYNHHFTASYQDTGSYSIDFNVSATGTYSSSWHDIWYSGSTVFFSGTFTLQSPDTSSGSLISNLRASMPNLKPVYTRDEKARLRLILEDSEAYRDVILSASYGSNPIFNKSVYYGVREDVTNRQVVAFDTGSSRGTRLGYNEGGHTFTMYMDSFVRGYTYRINFYLEHNGETKVLDEGWRFKVI